MYVYQRLKDIREDLDKKQEDIALVLGITRQQHQLYESGKREMPMHHFKENAFNMKRYIACLQEMTQQKINSLDLPVLVCGKDAPRPGGAAAIWVEYLPELQPYKDSEDPDKAGISAVFLYAPTTFDPSYYEDEELKDMGILRTFAYIGKPVGEGSVPGIVCVHGGLGHAYATYVLEAIKHGFAAIAIDTEGCVNTTGGTTGSAYNELEAAYVKDVAGHMGKDSFANVEGALEGQWIYNALCDISIANTVLRATEGVVAEEVGLTGISWGGLLTSTAIRYDERFAFCVPIYISFHMAESLGSSVVGLNTNAFAASLWQDEARFAASTVPTMLISSEKDGFASVDVLSATYRDLKTGYILIKPGLTHSQSAGASIPEIYCFGKKILEKGDTLITFDRQITEKDGHEYRVGLKIPDGMTNVTATLYYRTAPIEPYSSFATGPDFKSMPLSFDDAGVLTVSVPTSAACYYISVRGYSEEVRAVKETTPNYDGFEKGYLYTSSDFIQFEK